MALTPNFNPSTIAKAFAQQVRLIENAILGYLRYLGELAVAYARDQRTYQDQTGNLRASIGYLVLHNGAVKASAFQGATPEGRTAGQAFANEKGREHPTGWVLIVVAGMDYAVKVESRGLDVLTGAEQLAETELPGLIAQLKSDIAATAKLF